MPADDNDIVNPLELLLGYQLRRASAVVLAELVDRFEAKGLRLSESSVILFIAHNSGINQSSVGRMLDIQRANMAPLIALLLGQGLIERRKADGRSFGLYLTRRGKTRAAELNDIVAQHEARLIGALPAELRAGFGEALRALRLAWDPPLTEHVEEGDDEDTVDELATRVRGRRTRARA